MRPAGATADDLAADPVYDRIYEAILEHRLPPGTKLPEEKLAAVFKVSRARVRKVLARLGNENLIGVVPNKGAFIARPTFEESCDIFEARRALEPAIVRRLAKRATPGDVDRLQQHVEAEYQARAADDRRPVIRLSGEFHNLAADLAGNEAMARPMKELSALTCLAILLYDSPTSTTCRPDDHAHIVAMIKAGDGEGAAEAMTGHLAAIEQSMSFEDKTAPVDLGAIFS
ncbi:GntR family transcriptional regulator [Amycolatopsis sp. GM8]|uniref:GntR family transcriptional regulator n=1 Tax=Amycolatopsis sp. GM8 TaxID=2896530 RepID=UPI001F450BCF|nr:GntR family transcriptional regulator [Amycolatopsis sp. GM8]